ncbi:MAG TPA: metal ABC transporter ATP-binding protein [Phycisphaerae bacterium]|nr:metal ABC transporter ATP-binding protein [Phycisphaerae bacterium]HOJ72576.1 metal ABC transporter ATP-binding protein [Phycisphaerae bacterium]HOM49763.1 metal ABC transporter ATP-binding protein [Phycisphaerae bacterium]HON67439.1 metal ABC transporter ATP-binding protein [Phycisphaerae bacterium]HOQ86744.1 metal ABC transporter ATP-binding protein [Phycisphaerae bacterium]
MTSTARIPKDGYALRLRNVSVTLGGVQILSNVTAQPAVGALNAIIGPNGAGKTTLLRAILGLVPYTGTIQIGQTVEGEPLRLGYVPQRLDFDRGMPISVLDFMCAGLQRRPVWLGHSRTARSVAAKYLAQVGGSGWEHKSLGRLSGGELQRVLLAMALSHEPDILLLDEPVSGVDVAGEELFCDLLGSLQQQGRYTMLLVSHDLSIVTQHAQYVICLNQTVQCQGDAVTTLTAENLRALYRQDVSLYEHTGTHEGHAHKHHHGTGGQGHTGHGCPGPHSH